LFFHGAFAAHQTEKRIVSVIGWYEGGSG